MPLLSILGVLNKQMIYNMKGSIGPFMFTHSPMVHQYSP